MWPTLATRGLARACRAARRSPALPQCIAAAPSTLRSLSAIPEVAPAVRSAGLPEAVVVGPDSIPVAAMPPAPPTPSPEVKTLAEAISELQLVASKHTREQADLASIRPLVERSLSLAQGENLQQVATLAEIFVRLRLRLALRDLLPMLSGQLGGGAEQLPCAVRLLSAYGKASLFFSELFEFCDARLDAMQASDLATYVYETGRHGLRCRHFADAALPQTLALLPQMSSAQIMQAWQGYIRFSRDRKNFYQAALPRVQSQIRDLSAAQLLLGLRVARDLKHMEGFVQLHAMCSTELMVQMADLSLEQSAACLMQAAYSPRYRAQAQGLVRSIEQKWSRTEDLTPLRVVEIVDALQTFASWGMQPVALLERLDNMLCERRQELQYSGNVSLWINATQSFSKFDRFGARWPSVAIEFARDKYFVERCSFFQQCALVTCLGRMRLLDDLAFSNIADLLVSDYRLFAKVQDIAPILWSYATVGHFHQQLFDVSYDLVLEWMENETIDPSSPVVHGSLAQVAWSFAVVGFHKRYESFAALMDYVVFGAKGVNSPPHIRRLAQLADAVAVEAPTCAQNCQYPDELENLRTAPQVRNVVTSDPPGDAHLVQDIRAALAEMGWPSEAMIMPDDRSAFCIDISLEQKFGRKVALLTAGTFEQVHIGLPVEAQPQREAGVFQLHRRVLAKRGWSTVVVSRESWDQLQNSEQRKDFLEKVCHESLAA